MAMTLPNTTITPETALGGALKGFRQRCESAVDRLERINERFSFMPKAVDQKVGVPEVERTDHARQIDRIEHLLNEIHALIDTLEQRV